MCKQIDCQIIFFVMSAMNVDSAFQSAAEQGRRPLTRAELNRVLSARSARAYPYNLYGRQVYKRGTPAGLAKWGSSYRSATAQQKQNRVNDGIIGSGAYSLASAGRSLGARVGRYLGNKMGRTGLGDLGLAGQKLGQFAGGMAGGALQSRIMGSGAYTATNSLFKGGMGVPQFATMPGDETGALYINHTEYVQDILGTTAFTNQVFPINPGDPGVFPWLSQIAANYDEFEFSGLMFHFKSVTGDLSTADVQLGTVIMATNYNAGSPAFTTKTAMMEYDGAARVKVSEDLTSGVECDRSKNAGGGIMYVALNGSVPDGQDVKTYFPGVFQVATNQCASSKQIGELWVSYKVTLRKAKFAVNAGLQISCSSVRAGGAVLSGSGGVVVSSLNFLGSGNGYFNNLEDVKYDSTITQAFAPQVNGGVWTNSTPGFTVTAASGLGWHHAMGLTEVEFTYVFPPWLAQGTYQVTTCFTAGATTTITGQSYTESTGVTVNPGEVSDRLVVRNYTLKQSYAGTGTPQWIRIKYTGTFAYLNTAVFARCQIVMINPQIDISNAEV